ncbi:hypothetical protein L2E82_11024 [Cichorium intybus]|uniref:Uncharacterized protein n=1 Tax=Cichorium intybus TaxID=13427 RepID=A0ACB9GDA0_CICIN|nr:hypothetical protein L2E82_11024 [Cichorium intybus]
MGCVGSKPDDSPAVALCRKRCQFLDEAIHQRYALAEAHLAYFHSLKSVGDSLHRFFDLQYAAAGGGGDGPSSPVLNLPDHRKGDSSGPPAPAVTSAPVVAQRHSHSNSGSSHLNFHTDSDDDSGDDDESLHLHSENGGSSPLHQQRYGNLIYSDQHESLGGSYLPTAYPYSTAGYPPGGYPPAGFPPAGFPPAGYPSGGYTVNYMIKQPTPSVLYQQRPMSSEPIRYGEASSSSYYSSNYNNQNPSTYSYNNNYGEFFGSSSQQQPYGGSSSPPPVLQAEASSSNSKPPPPPPPPPSSSWDFLNPFETFEGYYPPYTPSRDSREVRDEEGIPDLEDEDFYQQEVVKEVHGNQKFVDTGGSVDDGDDSGGGDVKKAAVADEKSEERAAADLHYRSVPNVVAKQDDPVQYEVHVVDKQVVDNQKKPLVFQNDSEVVKELQTQFDRASDSGNELAKILEVGKVPHNRKHVAYQVPSKMLNVFTPSLALATSDPATLDADFDLLTKSKNLSSTLHKLYLWEKKLFDEVKIEEKMRLLHEEKKRRLTRLDEKGAEPHKIDATRTFVRSLSTKIRIAIQVVDKISEKINKLRDEELWPQLNDFIQGLTSMWRSMLECHHTQSQAIVAAKRIDAITSKKHLTDSSLEATLQLEHELLNWAIRFSCWFGAQKGFVRSLNEWLLKCLMYEPEETVDGPVPYSPGRLGAPAIFIICNQWAQSMGRISDKEVVDSMRDFAGSVLRLWERDKVEMRERMVVDKIMVKNFDKEDQKIHKGLQVLDKMIVDASGDDNGLSLGHPVYQSETSKNGSLQTSLQRVFESMERFTGASLKAYEELLQRIQEDKLAP